MPEEKACGAAVAEARRVLELDEAASPGPWTVATDEERTPDQSGECTLLWGPDNADETSNPIVLIGWYDGPQLGCSRENAALLAEYRTLAVSLARHVLAADAALAAWERWVALRKQWADDDLLIANPKDQKKLSHEMQAAYNDAVRLTAEARGK